jgi:CBS domain-containing protein
MSNITHPKSIEQLLEETSIKTLICESPSRPIVSIPATATISEAINVLSKNNLLSVLVEDPAIDAKKKYLGFVDMFDILGYVIKTYTEEKEISDGQKWLTWSHDIGQLTYKGKLFAIHPIKDCIDLSKINPFCSVHISSLLPPLLYIFKRGVHRAAVVDDDDKVVHVVTQSTVIQFLARHINHFGRIATTTIEKIGLGFQTVLYVNPEVRAIHAFYQMWFHKVSGVAVVDGNGALLANLSVTDLKGLSQENFPSLLDPVLEFIDKQVKYKKIPPITVTPDTTFETVVLKIAATGVHRLWIMDKDKKPVGLVSLTDVMNLLDLRVYIDQNLL